ncbi:MAG: DNA mismatch repair endonuclease MutL [Eubacteriales bacterium]|nr:DNA mismatch repair endonuclease MutL [Eubacteriales bacterium]
MIRVLDQVTADGIAAGEVIERPASVVKELVENALDAGASRINIEIAQGGIRLIRVADNGSGMNPADADLAFARHATSKLQKLQDLDHISSMGFRGEALASIAAVSRVKLLTRTQDQDQGYLVRLEAGHCLEAGAKAANVGSVFEVEDLFFNTPARYKFLKRDATEAAYVQDLVERLSFSRPDIAFSLMKDGKQSFVSPGDGKLISVIYTVWGRESAEAALPLDEEWSGLKITGYISKSSHSRRNRSRQIFLVNGRIIQSPLLKVAVDKAIQGHFVKGNFPELVLQISLPASKVDVNVHPQKTEVRFAEENEVFRAVYHGLQEVLLRHSGIKDVQLTSAPLTQAAPSGRQAAGDPRGAVTGVREEGSIPQQTQLQLEEVMSSSNAENTCNDDTKELFLQAGLNSGNDELSNKNTSHNQKNKASSGPAKSLFSPRPQSSTPVTPSLSALSYQERLRPDQQAAVFAEASRKTSDSDLPSGLSSDLQELAQARIIGQAFNTYLLLEAGDNLLLIDQHAAHERILYEQLRAKRQAAPAEGASQLLLQPLSLKFSPLELVQALDQAAELHKMGFAFEEFGQEVLVLRAIPLEFSQLGLNPELAFRSMVEQASQGRLDEAERLDEILHTTACKAAVKAHDILSYQEMEQVIQDLLKLEDPYHCPHGRPVILRLSTTDIEKFFRRIV